MIDRKTRLMLYDKARSFSSSNFVFTGRQANYLLADAANKLSMLGYDIEIDEDNMYGGTTSLNPDGSLKYTVSNKILLDSWDDNNLAIHKALSPIVTLYHETYVHGGQWKYESMKDKILSKVLLLDDRAVRSSQYFCGSNIGDTSEQYVRQPYEIAAQYMGIKGTHAYLTNKFGEETATDYMLRYVNLDVLERDWAYLEIPDDFVPRDRTAPAYGPDVPFHSMEQVYEQFQKTFEKSLSERVEYKVPGRDMLPDTAAQYAEGLRFFKERAFRHAINHLPDRYSQTYALTAVWFDQNPEYMGLLERPAFNGLDLKPDIHKFRNIDFSRPDSADVLLDSLTLPDLISFEDAVAKISHNMDKFEL